LMKFLVLIALFASSAVATVQHERDNTITKVVKLLQGMLDKSKAEGDEERKIYAKFNATAISRKLRRMLQSNH